MDFVSPVTESELEIEEDDGTWLLMSCLSDIQCVLDFAGYRK